MPLKATELRIGNWVYRNLISKNEPFQITKGFQIDSADDELVNYEPIPLSPDILIACEFKHSSSSLDLDTTMMIKIDVGRDDNKDVFLYIDGTHNDFSCSIGWLNQGSIYFGSYNYLHQLQNIFFAICNQELNYKPLTKTA